MDVAARPHQAPFALEATAPPRTAPASFLQEQLWLIEQEEAGRSLYNEVRALRLVGPLDAHALEAGLSALVARHEALRTTFGLEGGDLVQRIEPPRALALEQADLSALPREERGAAGLDWAQAVAGRPYDLSRGPLVRAGLARLSADEHLLLLAVHHAVCDGESMDQLLRELDAACSGGESGPPAVAAQYADFARWQRNALAEGLLERERVYWRRTLAGAPTVLELPAPRLRPRRKNIGGRREAFPLGRDLVAELDRASAELGCTRFAFLLAAFAALLHGETGRDDLLIGTGLRARPGIRFDAVVGYFANTVPLRLRPSSGLRLTELVEAASDAIFDALDHELLPFEKIVELVRPARDPSFTPLVQIVFALWEGGPYERSFGSVTASPVEIPRSRARFDLVLEVVTRPGDATVFVEYDTALFEPADVAQRLERYRRLLAAAVERPSLRVAELVAHEEPRMEPGRAVNVGGVDVQLELVELALLEHPAVEDAAVVARPDVLVAYVVCGGAEKAVREFAAARLPRYALPAAVVPVPSIPRSGGALDESLLPGVEPAAPSALEARYPRLESALSALWAEVMELDDVRPHEDFFALGGHSMLAVRLLNAIAESLGVEVGLLTLYDHCTVAALAAELERESPNLEARLERAEEAPVSIGLPGPPATAPRAFPLSGSQLQIWVSEQLFGARARDYVAALSYRVRGPLDLSALREALNAVVARHEVLRGSVTLDGDEPVLHVAPELRLEVPVADVDAGDLEAAVAAITQRRLDVEAGPLVHAHLLRVGPQDHALVLVQHHLATDATSMDVFTRELAELYRGEVTGRLPELPPLRVPYHEYVAWEREWLAGERAAEATRFWQERLAGVRELELGGRAGRESLATATVSQVIDGEALRRVRELAASCRATPFAVATAAFVAMLRSWGGTDDVVIGTTVENRPLRGLERTIGCCVNLVPLRVDCAGAGQLRDVVGRVRAAQSEASKYQTLPFARIVRTLGLAPMVDRMPLVQVTSDWVERGQIALDLVGCEVEAAPVAQGTLRFELGLYSGLSADGLVLDLEYASDLWAEDFVRGRLDEVVGVLAR